MTTQHLPERLEPQAPQATTTEAHQELSDAALAQITGGTGGSRETDQDISDLIVGPSGGAPGGHVK